MAWRIFKTSGRVALAALAAASSESEKLRFAAIALVSFDSEFAAAFSVSIALRRVGAILRAVAGHAVARGISEMVLCAFGAFRTGRIVAAVETAPVPEFRVENARVCTPVALALFALGRIFGRCTRPRLVVEQRLAHLTVVAHRVVLALALVDAGTVWQTDRSVEVALAATHHEHFRNRVVVRSLQGSKF